jgi:hypothetical protein
MDDNKFYLVTQTPDGQVLYILSEWNGFKDRPGPNFSICQLTIYTNNMLFQSEFLTSDNINSLICIPDLYFRLRSYFRKNAQDIRFKFQVSNEEDEAHLELSLPLDHTLTNYVKLLEANLHRIFKHNSHLEFLNKLGNFAQFKERQQDQAAERLEGLESIQGIVEETKTAVERLRQQAGLQLAAQVRFT